MVYSNSLSHPNMFSTVSGRTMVDTAIESINRCISLLILTGITELFGEPEFGSAIYETTFDFVTDAYIDQLKLIISDAIAKFEKRVVCKPEDINARYNNETNNIHITIGYNVKNSQQFVETDFEVEVG